MDKIAIIGISTLFPEASTPQEFWQNLIEEKDARSLATEAQMGGSPERFYDAQKGTPDKYYCLNGGYIRGFDFDPNGFALEPQVLENLDDVFQWSLYVSREALKDSGYWKDPSVLAQCGVILGNLSFPTKRSNHLFVPMYHQAAESVLQELLQDPQFQLERFAPAQDTSLSNAMTAGYPSALIAQALSLSGAHFSLDAACASSLYAVKLACDYLHSGKADLMLAGAVSSADPFFINMGFSIFQAYPEENGSSPLDKRSQGLYAGEGAGMFVLKRYNDAVRDGDRIHGVIRGAGLSNDGKGQFVLSPNPKGQQLAFERAYADAGVDPKSIDYVECHATGTPLGDKVELNSMDAFFGKYGASPLVGSAKSNLGHLLTAAGMAGMTKVILSMAANTLPATIHIDDPQSSQNDVIAAENIVRTSTPWPSSEATRRAAVSAFGFGGCNAHLIFENVVSESSAPQPAAQENTPPISLAIVGMDALFGPCEGLAAFQRSIYDGEQHFIPLPPERWKGLDEQADLMKTWGFEQGKAPLGAYIDSFDMDFLRFKIPPNETDQLIPQQLLILKVVENAIQDAQLRAGENVAVVIAMETELALHQFRGRVNLSSQWENSFAQSNITLSLEQKAALQDLVKDSLHNPAQVNQYTSFIGNIMASRISSLWDFSGPAFTVSSEENSVFKALEVAQLLLSAGDVDAVVVGAVDLSGSMEKVWMRHHVAPLNTGTPTLSYAHDANGWMVGEGAGAVVVKALDSHTETLPTERVYATVDAIGFASGATGAAVEQACQQALAQAQCQASDVEYVEASGSGVPQEDAAEMEGLFQTYRIAQTTPHCAIGSVKANIGHTFAASGMASLIKTALCLYHRMIPQTPQWSSPKQSERWQESPFYVPTASKTWFAQTPKHKRRAAVNGLGTDQTCAHVILSEVPQHTSPSPLYLQETPLCFFPLVGDNQNALQKALDDLEQKVRSGVPLSQLANHFLEQASTQTQAPYALGLIGEGKENLLQEITAARTGVTHALETQTEWNCPKGSYFSAKPLGSKGKVAFVYPGGFTSYPGVGQDLFQLFPKLYSQVAQHTPHVEQMIKDHLFYPRSVHRLNENERKAIAHQLIESPTAMFESGIAFAVLYTDLLKNYFGVAPDAALGYSMGEVSMMFALGVWEKTDRMSQALHTSPVFQTRLAGPMETVREAWNLPNAAISTEPVWECYALKTSVSLAEAAVATESRVYVIIINTPHDVVIAGDPQACQRVIQQLGCESFPVPMSDVIHCDLVQPDHQALVGLHLETVQPISGIDFYSVNNYAPITLSREGVARNIADIYCKQVDFPKLVKQAYDDGARVFLELGPRDSCTQWIDSILQQQDHVAVAIDRKGADTHLSVLRALAKLCSHRVPLDLSPLRGPEEPAHASKKQLMRTVHLGGPRLESTILTEENRNRFHNPLTPSISQPSPEVPMKAPTIDLNISQSSTPPISFTSAGNGIGNSVELSGSPAWESARDAPGVFVAKCVVAQFSPLGLFGRTASGSPTARRNVAMANGRLEKSLCFLRGPPTLSKKYPRKQPFVATARSKTHDKATCSGQAPRPGQTIATE